MRRILSATAALLAGFTMLACTVAGTLGVTDTLAAVGTTGTTGTTGVAGPAAAGPVVASLSADVPIAAGGGWVVWSVPVAGGFGLDASHGGVVRPLAIAPRPQPFDLSVGTSSTLAPVVTFSRCVGLSTHPVQVFPPAVGRDCRVRVFNLRTQQETTPAIPHPSATSDTKPAIWHGRIAFARLDPAHHQNVEQVMLWRPGHRSLSTLPHGAMPTKCPFRGGCAGMPRSGTVDGLAYDGDLVSFLWLPIAPGVIGDGGFEVRADTVATGRARLVGDGFAGEVCTGGLDLSAPSSPALDGYTVTFSSLQADCFVFNSLVSQVNAAATGNGSYGALAGNVLTLAQDGSSFYALEAPTPTTEIDPTCTTAAPCQIQRITLPALIPEPDRPTSPFFD
jgi:hypothetical protein